MRKVSTRVLPLAILGVLLAFGCAAPPPDVDVGGEPDPPPPLPPLAVLDGHPKSLVLIGYSTSYAWPSMLQEMLDAHSDGKRVYHLLNAVVGGSPVGRWISRFDSKDYKDTYGAMRRDFFGPEARLRGEAPAPSIALLQQSLQRTPTPETRLGPVRASDDEEGIRIGADSLEKLVRQLRSDGIQGIFIAMHIYKKGYEPEVGNERFALQELLGRDYDFVHAGPDVWSPTLREHPDAFTEDGLHPNQRGAKIMAEAWYRCLAGKDARQEIIDDMRAKDWDVEALMKSYLTWRRGGEPAR